MVLRLLPVLILLMNNLAASFSDAEEARSYIARYILAESRPIVLPDGLDIDGNKVTSGRPFIVEPYQDREPFEELRLGYVGQLVETKKQFERETDRAEKIKLRNKLYRLELARAVIGNPLGWSRLGMMLNSPERYLTKKQRARHDYFVKQADLYFNYGRVEQSFFSEMTTRFKYLFSSHRTRAEHYRKLD